MKDLREIYEVKDKLFNELKEYAKKDKLDMTSVTAIDTLAHALKNMCKICESYENEGYDGYSNNAMPYMPRYNVSYARGRGSNARRDSMGRYSSRDGGYSNNDDFMMELQDLAQNAPNDYVRQKMMDVMNDM